MGVTYSNSGNIFSNQNVLIASGEKGNAIIIQGWDEQPEIATRLDNH